MTRFFFLAILIIGSCSPPSQTTHYDEVRLVPLFIDIHMAKAAIQNAPPAIRDSLYAVYFRQICTIHQVDEDSLKHDLDFLTREPDRMERLYSQVVDSLEVRMNNTHTVD